METKEIDEQMIFIEEDNVTNDTPREPEIVMLKLAAFIRPNFRFKEQGETFEDYKKSMKIQQRVRRTIKKFGSQHKVGYDTVDTQLYWVMKPNVTLVIPGTRRRFQNGEGRFKDSNDKRRGSYAGASGNVGSDVVRPDTDRVSVG